MQKHPHLHIHPDIYELLTCFLVCGFIGWVYETIFTFIEMGHFMDRGFLFVMGPLSQYIPALRGVPVLGGVPLVWGLPVILIYGIGGAIMCIGFRGLAKRPVLLFFTGFFLLSLVELAGSYIAEGLFHQQFWDYSELPFNFQGRICLYSALAWGVLSVLAVKFVAPLIHRFYTKLQTRRHWRGIILVLCAYTAFCAFAKYVLFPGLPGS